MKLTFLILILISYISSFGTVKIACIGNSITSGSSVGITNSYPYKLQDLLGDNYIVNNYGIGGATILRQGNYPYWENCNWDDLTSFNPDIITIKLGTNDTKSGNWLYKENFKKDYIALIDTLKK